MPVHTGKDAKGCYAQWGTGKKYYYACGDADARSRAKKKAEKQGAAAYASGYRGNEMDEKKKKTAVFHALKMQANVGSDLVRKDMMEDREWTVVPMVMMVEGVHAGTAGPLYYSADELAKTPMVWNHKPVVVYHPQYNGQPISACDPDVLSTSKVGVIMNTHFDDGKLKAEAWLDPDRMEKVDKRIAAAVENQSMMELSTGLFTDDEYIGNAEWNGESYEWAAKNYRPDHLALLPDLKGACSIADGAGFLRLNQEGDSVQCNISGVPEDILKYFEENKDRIAKEFEEMLRRNAEIAHDDVRSLLYGWLREKVEDAWIVDIFDTFFIYEDNGNYYRQSYEIDNDNRVKITGIAEVVTKKVTYEPVTLSEKKGTDTGDDSAEETDSMKGNIMNKNELVKSLISNAATAWSEQDEEYLMGLDEDKLQKMVPIVNDEDEPSVEEPPVEEPPAEELPAEEPPVETPPATEPQVNMKKARKPVTVNEYLNDPNIPQEIRDVLHEGMASRSADRTRLINVITANERNVFSREQLDKKPSEELRALAKLAAPEEQPHSNYLGQADPMTMNDAGDVEPLPVPNWND